ncbi:hypothetical protein MtrunA17_Chr8g0336811 [Medicago truncatula]|uniref:Uncharacterized protein n=1 Tax=Medicago truncatula TaxID=3880 RepID=A0A396GGI7_MEDTR|nr:hypothetical protein MtrunA17_Chr8g0336811 [Medicago truncatula]
MTCGEKACYRYSRTNFIRKYSVFNTLESVICYKLQEDHQY